MDRDIETAPQIHLHFLKEGERHTEGNTNAICTEFLYLLKKKAILTKSTNVIKKDVSGSYRRAFVSSVKDLEIPKS